MLVTIFPDCRNLLHSVVVYMMMVLFLFVLSLMRLGAEAAEGRASTIGVVLSSNNYEPVMELCQILCTAD